MDKIENEYDVIVYGGTPAGVIASIAASRNYAKVLLIEQTRHVGGLNTSGINTGENQHMVDKAITGMAREFYKKLGEEYSEEYFQTFKLGRSLSFKKGDPAFFFESHDAEKVFNDMLREAGVDLLLDKYLTDVKTSNNTIDEIVLDDGMKLKGKIYIDCTYEGDLMARSGVSYTYGREGIDVYNESYAGVRFMDDTLESRTVDQNGQLLPYFTENENLVPGTGDQRVICYNFRPTMTKDPDNMRPVTRPENYDSTRYQLLADFLNKYPETEITGLIGIYDRGSGKYEFNNRQHSTISLGIFGGNVDYPDSDYETRERIYQDHKDYTLGYLYFIGHDPRIPPKLKEQALSFGFAKDEFKDNLNFPYYLYVREARRMMGEFVFTQDDILKNRTKKDAVTLGSHWIDSHHVQRIAISDTSFTNEGRIWHVVTQPFELPYSIILPKREEIKNLLVPVCASLSHVAFCAYRLEATWMQMGQVAGTAAGLSLISKVDPHDLNIDELQYQLRLEGMMIKNDDIGNYDDYADPEMWNWE